MSARHGLVAGPAPSTPGRVRRSSSGCSLPSRLLGVTSSVTTRPDVNRRTEDGRCALADLGGPAGPVGRPELTLEELARAGARQLVHEVHRPGHLVAGQVLARV